MDLRVRVFIDFWNFQLTWNSRTSKTRIDWPRVPGVLVSTAQELLRTAGSPDVLHLSESRVYASYDPESDSANPLRGWLESFLDRQPGFRVLVRERRGREVPSRCSTCGHEVTACPQCATPYRRSDEKGVDVAIVTDLLSLAWEDAYDVAILVTSDADFIPAVERLQDKGLKVINATWGGRGHELARASWGSFNLDTLTTVLERSGIPHSTPMSSSYAPPVG